MHNDPTGRIDILIQRFLELAAEHAERRFDVPGFAEAARPEISKLVSSIRGSKLSPLLLTVLRKVSDEYVASIAKR